MSKPTAVSRRTLDGMQSEKHTEHAAKTAPTDAVARPDDGRLAKRWPELTVLLAGQSLGSMAIAVVSVAAPAIRGRLHVDGGVLQMAVSGYGLAYTVLLVTGARLGDRGHRRLFLLGTALFGIAGLVSGLAPTATVLIAGQLLQGAGAALLVPQVLSLIQLTFSGAARARAVSLYAMTLGLGVAVGLLVGGLLIAEDPTWLSWRAVFLVNAPLGCLVLAGGRRWLSADRSGEPRPLDRRGFLAFTAAIGWLVVPLAFGPSAGWPAWTWVMLAVALAAALAFHRIERGVSRHGVQPLLDLAVLAVPRMFPGLVVVLMSMGGYGGLIYTMSAFLQEGLRYGVLRSAVILAAYAVGFSSVNLTWSRLPPHYHRSVAPVALTVLSLAEASMALATRNGPVLAAIVPLLAAAGAGHGAGFGAVVGRLTAHMPARLAPTASGVVNTATQLAILGGIAGLGSAFLADRRPTGPSGGFAHPMSDLLIVLAACSAVAMLCSLRASRPLRDRRQPAQDASDLRDAS